MPKEMLINVSQGEECRIALVEDERLEELYMERNSATSHVGNIYKGRVTNVEPSIQAAFIDFGLGRNGFLHISDLMPTYFGGTGGDVQETVGRKMARRDRPPIQRCLRRGDDIIVQIIKEGIGTKGPTLTTYLSIPGRILVMMPGMSKMGVSRKIEDDEERRRLRQILDSLKPPKDVGFIIRTAGVGKSKTEIQRDLTYLTRLWTIFVKKRDSGPGPLELYTEGDLVTRTVRDVFTSDIDRIIVDDKEVAKRVKEVIKLANPRTKNKVEYFDEPVPLFHKYGIEREIEQMYSRHVPLPSGGSLVIDSTEAIVAIDVNSGKFREHADAETTAFKTDMEAADEIPRQLRLRDLGGVIICDFIDLRYERHRRDLEQRLHTNFQKDRAKTKVLRMSQFGIIEITRQRMRPSLKRSIYFDCPHCKGAGLVKTPESMSLDVMRRMAVAMSDGRVARVELIVCSDVAFYLQNKKRAQIVQLEQEMKKRVMIRSDQSIALDDVRFELYDARDGLVFVEELGMSPPSAAPSAAGASRGGGRPDQNRGRQRDNNGRNQRGGRGGRQDQRGGQRSPEPQHGRAQEEDQFDIDAVEEEVDRREQDSDDEEAVSTAPIASESATDDAGPDDGQGAENVQPNQQERPRDGRGGPNDAQGGQGEGFEDGPGGPRRRRRRRGRRGRGGGGQREEFAGQQGNNRPPQANFNAGPRGNGPRDNGPRDNGPRENGPRDNRPRGNDSRDNRGRDFSRNRDDRQGGLQPQQQAIGGYIDEYDVDDQDISEPNSTAGPDSGAAGAQDRALTGNVDGDEPIDRDEITTTEESAAVEETAPRAKPAGRPRRRGKRGGAGRRVPPGANANAAIADPPQAESSGNVAEEEVIDAEPGNERMPEAETPETAPRRRRRGGRGRRGKGGDKTAAAKTGSRAEAVEKAPVAASPKQSSKAPIDDAPRATEAKTLLRTGSADRHLINDEPIAPQPMTRPRSYKDLDSIPDDFD
ncbi:MAG: Rne/Rng family ribonuclease [Planctomycetota bacterium]|nr:Rne/Rng family ribonuclease [Planctomycetota bacterium]